MSFDDPPAMLSPPDSPRSSVSSSTPAHAPLTPLDELTVADMLIADDDDDPNLHSARSSLSEPQRKHRPHLSLSLDVPAPGLSHFTFPPIMSPPARSPRFAPSPTFGVEAALPQEEFVFGDCPVQPFLGTPVAEQGPFEYPDLGGSSSPPLSSSPKSSSFRTRRPLSISSQSSLPPHPEYSPPKVRRGSTNSNIATLPIAGRRPSIVHSATVEGSVPVSAESTPSQSPFPPPLVLPRQRPAALMYQQKNMPAPIPPSLLARRGSLPAAQLFGLPLHDLQNRSKSANHPSNQAGPVITAASLYQRRQSVVSESAAHAPLIQAPALPTFNADRRPSLPAISPSLLPPRMTPKVARSTSISHAPRQAFSPRSRLGHLPLALGIPPSPRSLSHERMYSFTSSDEDEPVTPSTFSAGEAGEAAVVGLWDGGVVDSPLVASSIEGEVPKGLPVPMAAPLESPGLETVHERPPLESASSGESVESVETLRS
ncbi:hypothetical protein IAR50_005807 [Cryptococcus sp. DSM 104548]